jgi:hypothetical protein
MELDLFVDNIVNELALDDKLGREVLEPPDFFRIYDGFGFDVLGNVFKIVLALTSVPDPVPRVGPGIGFEEKIVQLYHNVSVISLSDILSPSDARSIGNSIDFVVFDGYTKAKDEKGDAVSVVLVEVKKGVGIRRKNEGLPRVMRLVTQQ